MAEATETKHKPDCILTDGTAVDFDKRNIRPREWRALFDPQQSDEEGQAIMARFAGLDEAYVAELSMYDWQLLMAAAIVKVREPVDPNLRSASIPQS